MNCPQRRRRAVTAGVSGSVPRLSTLSLSSTTGHLLNLSSLAHFAFTDDVDLAVADQHSAIADNRQLRHLCANARSLRTCQRDQLRSMDNGDGAHEVLKR